MTDYLYQIELNEYEVRRQLMLFGAIHVKVNQRHPAFVRITVNSQDYGFDIRFINRFLLVDEDGSATFDYPSFCWHVYNKHFHNLRSTKYEPATVLRKFERDHAVLRQLIEPNSWRYAPC